MFTIICTKQKYHGGSNWFNKTNDKNNRINSCKQHGLLPKTFMEDIQTQKILTVKYKAST